MVMILDDWQKEVMDKGGNIVLRSGRQVGKSTVISKKAAEYAVRNSKKNIMVIASVERQSLLLFEKILSELHEHHRKFIKGGKYRPTKHKITLTNGSTIYCLPTGLSGYGIRGYTIDLLIADEAAFIPDEVWTAVTPMLAITRGDIILLSTPFGKKGYFYRCFEDESFTSFHVSSEDCPRKDTKFLSQEKERMSELQYAQEYLGEFVDELRQFFPDSLIRKCLTIPRGSKGSMLPSPASGGLYLGVDVARMGGDETVLFSLELNRHDKLVEVERGISRNSLLTETVSRILESDLIHNYRRIYVDDGGLGVGVFDPLLVHAQTKRRVVAINNASRSIDRYTKHKKLLKEDLYNNLLHLMESGRISLVNSDKTAASLRCVQAEYKEDRLRLFGNYTHIVEALIRAAWCVKDKRLNIWIR